MLLHQERFPTNLLVRPSVSTQMLPRSTTRCDTACLLSTQIRRRPIGLNDYPDQTRNSQVPDPAGLDQIWPVPYLGSMWTTDSAARAWWILNSYSHMVGCVDQATVVDIWDTPKHEWPKGQSCWPAWHLRVPLKSYRKSLFVSRAIYCNT